jgi:hypothetical protein
VQPLAQRASRQTRGVILPTGNSGKQQGDVSGAGEKPVETNRTKASGCQSSSMRSPPALHASHDCTMQSTAPRPAYLVQLPKTQFLVYTPEKNVLPMHIPVAPKGPGWGKLRGENSLGLIPIGSPPVRAFPPAFRQSGVFSVVSESGCFARFPGEVTYSKKRNGARNGLVLVYLRCPPVVGAYTIG